jgi:hypothetical protein
MAQKLEAFTANVTLWVARLALTILAYAGLMSFLGRVDDIIANGITILLVAFLVKETL